MPDTPPMNSDVIEFEIARAILNLPVSIDVPAPGMSINTFRVGPDDLRDAMANPHWRDTILRPLCSDIAKRMAAIAHERDDRFALPQDGTIMSPPTTEFLPGEPKKEIVVNMGGGDLHIHIPEQKPIYISDSARPADG